MLEARSYFGAVTIGSAGPGEMQDLFDLLIIKASSDRQWRSGVEGVQVAHFTSPLF
jgi:hypothetical protein